jgi:ABC-type sugar transport system ATPase subunit
MNNRGCFYCGEQTHFVDQCVNPDFLELYRNMKNIHLETRLTQNHRVNHNAFANEMSQFNFNDIISVAIKYAYAMYPGSVVATYDYYNSSLWSQFEHQYLRNREIIINNLVSVTNMYFIGAPNMNSEPTTINDSNDALSVIRRQRHLSIINRNKNKNTQKKHNFITTIETEKYTDEEEECPICLDNVKCIKLVKLNCDHKFCVKCIIKSVKMNRNNYSCALCRCVVETVRMYDTDTYDLVRQL